MPTAKLLRAKTGMYPGNVLEKGLAVWVLKL